MKTIVDVKQDLIDYLLSVDKASLSMSDLKVYSEVVNIADMMSRPNPLDCFPAIVNSLNTMIENQSVEPKGGIICG